MMAKLQRTTRPLRFTELRKRYSLKIRRRTAQLTLFTTCLVTSISTLGSVLLPTHAYAWTTAPLPTCNVDLSFNWQDKINRNNNPNSAILDVGSYLGDSIMFKSSADSSTQFRVYFGDNSANNQFYKDTDGTYKFKLYDINAVQDGTHNTQFRLNSADKTITTLGVTPNTNPTPVTDVTCVRYAHGFDYASTWDMPTFGTAVPAQSSTACAGVLDVGCWINKAFNGVSDTISAVAKATLAAFSALFVPDTAKLQSEFDNMKTDLMDHLGFLAFPVTWVVDFYNAFTNTGGWCTDTGCTKDFGNFLGSDLTINFAQLHTTMPTIWNFFIGFIQGSTVLVLIFATYRRGKAILDR